MCTVGFSRTDNEYIVFKKRKLEKKYTKCGKLHHESSDSALWLTGFNLKNDDSEGVPIGINKSNVSAANTHVISSKDATSDKLCLEILSKVNSQSELQKIVKEYTALNKSQGGRILVAAPQWACIVEIHKHEYGILKLRKSVVITNQFEQLPYGKKVDLNSRGRNNNACNLLKMVVISKALKTCGVRICLQKGVTESSHIIEVNEYGAFGASLYGKPCENDYSVKELFV